MPAGSADVSSELLRSQRAGTNSILRAREDFSEAGKRSHHKRSSIDWSAFLISSARKEMLPPCPASTYSKWNCSRRSSERF